MTPVSSSSSSSSSSFGGTPRGVSCMCWRGKVKLCVIVLSESKRM